MLNWSGIPRIENKTKKKTTDKNSGKWRFVYRRLEMGKTQDVFLEEGETLDVGGDVVGHKTGKVGPSQAINMQHTFF